MKYEIDIEVGELHCNIELELEIACFCEEVEIDDFTVNKVYVYDDSDGSEYAIKTLSECSDFMAKYGNLIQSELDSDTGQCKFIISEIIDYLKDGETDRLIDNYEYNRDYGSSSMAKNLMFGGVEY